MPQQRASAKRLEDLRRTQFALEARKAGKTYSQIGDALGISKQNAHKRVMRALAKWKDEIGEDIDELRSLELARLERMHETLWMRFQGGELKAGTLLLQVMDRRIKLLGLAAPVKVAPTDSDGNDLDLSRERPRDSDEALEGLLALVNRRGAAMGEDPDGSAGGGDSRAGSEDGSGDRTTH